MPVTSETIEKPVVAIPGAKGESTGLRDDYRGHNMVFIVGCPRSGTTYLQRLLACHPLIKTGQESDVFDSYIGPMLRTWNRDLYEPIDGRGGLGMACYLSEKDFIESLRRFMLDLIVPMVSGLGDCQLFVEKTPSHALYISEISQLLPDTRFIHMYRDPRDVVASLVAAGRSWGSKWAPKKASYAAWMWREHIEAVENSKAKLPSDTFLELRYEDIKADGVDTLSRVAGFLGIQWDTANMEEAIGQNSFENVKKGGGTPIRRWGEYAKSSSRVVSEPQGFVRRKAPGGWKKDLTFREKIAVWRIAGRKMAQYGYRWKTAFVTHGHMKTSVIIPTYKRREQVLDAVVSLRSQTFKDFELIVVDNAGDPELQRRIQEISSSVSDTVRYVRHTVGGSSGARNRGAFEASGDLLIYGDDDLVFDDQWVQSYVEAFTEHPEMIAAGGKVLAQWQTQPARWLEDYVSGGECCPVFALMNLGARTLLSSCGFFFSCNMAIRKDALAKYGGFRPELFGRETIGSGEWGLVLELRERGELIGYVPGAVAHHRIPAHRMTVDYIRKWAWHGAGCDMYERWKGRRRTTARFAKELLRIVSEHWWQWLRRLGVRRADRRDAIDLLFSSSRGLCELNYLWWMLTRKRIRNALDGRQFLATCL